MTADIIDDDALPAPIQNVDSFDVVGERIGGGVDLVVSCTGPLDDSAETVRLIEQKVVGYLRTAAHPNFKQVYPAAQGGPVRIFISCQYAVGTTAAGMIRRLAERAAAQGVELLLVNDMGDRHNAQ
jgi:hypothetical protein